MAVCVAASGACGGAHLGGPAGTGGGTLVVTGTGGAAGGTGATAGGSVGGAGGGTVVPPDPCTGPSDARLVLAPQRQVPLTSHEMNYMIRALFGDAEANAVISAQILQLTPDASLNFPPSDGDELSINDVVLMEFASQAKHVGQYVADNFSTVTGCAPSTDDCAKAYLAAVAEKAYRRLLDTTEQTDLLARYDSARGSATIEQATQQGVAAILTAPQFYYRSEMGDPTRASTSPPGVPLTPDELASALSFFLTDGPPDQPLLDAARAGTLTPDTVGPQVDRLLGTLAARAWLTKLMELYFELNQLPTAPIDSSMYPEVTPTLLADMQTEAHMFIEARLWDDTLTGLLTSRATFLNSRLATTIYKVPAPGATATDFVPTTLPADQRSGILTNAGFLSTLSRSTEVSLVRRGYVVKTRMLGTYLPYHSDSSMTPIVQADFGSLSTRTPQKQVAGRASMPACDTCHGQIDPYGLALANYDIMGRYTLVDPNGMAIDPHTTLPQEAGGAAIAGAADLANALAASPGFVNEMAWAMLQYGMIDLVVTVEHPSLPGQPPTAACAVNDLVQRFLNRPAQTFPGLIREVATSPAFAYRRQIQ